MADSKRNALVPRPGTEVAAPGRRTPRVIEQMVRDVLARAREQVLSQARFRIGDTALREPDYRQILHWAEALGKAPEEVLATLAACRVEPETWDHWEAVGFAVEDGAIVSLAWHFGRLPLIPETWETGLCIRTLGLRGKWPHDSAAWRPSLPQLERLICRSNLRLLDLSQVPGLTKLDCSWNKLTALDLAPVPGLTELNCEGNKLTTLDLAPVPGLTTLRYYRDVPRLTTLRCDWDVRLLNAPPGLKIYR